MSHAAPHMPATSAGVANPLLEADCIGMRFGRRKVLSSASLRIVPGLLTALLGRNGAGKSTLLRIAAGMLSPESGTVRFEGANIANASLPELARRGVFFLPDRDLLHPALETGSQLPAIADWFDTGVQLSDVAEQLGIARVLQQRPASLSGGERRRAEIAAAMMRAPRVFMLDEPLRGIQPLDAEQIMSALRTLAARGAAVVLTGHELPLILPHVDRVTWCANGTTREFPSTEAAASDFTFQRDFLGSA